MVKRSVKTAAVSRRPGGTAHTEQDRRLRGRTERKNTYHTEVLNVGELLF